MAGMNFGHLIGLGRPQTGKQAAEDDEDDDERMEEDDTDDEKDDSPASAEDDDEDETDASAEDDDSSDDDDDKQESKAVKAARLQERRRCAAIFASDKAAANIPLAAHLAFNTSMSAKQAIGALAAAPGAKPGLAGRMAAMGNVKISSASDRPADKKTRIDAGWDRALAKAGLRPRA